MLSEKHINFVIQEVRKTLKNGKRTLTYKALAEKIGNNYSAAQVRYIWDTYGKSTPSSDVLSSDYYEDTHDVPSNFEVSSIRVTSTGATSRTYRKKDKDDTLDYLALIDEAIAQAKSYSLRTWKPSKFKGVSLIKHQHIVIGDVHIGMAIKKSPFNSEWHNKELHRRWTKVIDDTKPCKDLTIYFMGDFADGERGKTASNTHTLQQNLTDDEIFVTGLDSLIFLVENLLLKVEGTLFVQFISNSNHPTVVDLNMIKALQRVLRNEPRVVINILDDPFNPTRIQNIPAIITHGKDREFMKRGLPYKLSADHYLGMRKVLESNKLTYYHNPHLSKKFIVLRADLHQFKFVATDLAYDILTPAFCPPSGWIANNFLNCDNGGYLTFVIEDDVPIVTLKEF